MQVLENLQQMPFSSKVTLLCFKSILHTHTLNSEAICFPYKAYTTEDFLMVVALGIFFPTWGIPFSAPS